MTSPSRSHCRLHGLLQINLPPPSPPPTSPIYPPTNMSRSIAPSRTLLKKLQGSSAATQPCRRFLSSAQSPTFKRPVAPRSIESQSRHQPLTQKRFKYKSVEEAKSQYRVGVGKFVRRLDAQIQCAGSIRRLTLISCTRSLSLGKRHYCSSQQPVV